MSDVRRSALGKGLLALLYLGAAAIGVGSAWVVLTQAAGMGRAAGPWHVSLLAGSADADAHTRARVALGGLLALNREETMYYLAQVDSQGRPLRSRCTYRVSGVPPAARWWSVTAYAGDFYLFPDEAHRYSVNGLNARLDAEGRFALVTAPAEPPAAQRAGAPWLPTPGDRGLVFTLRIYNPGPALVAAPGALVPPLIERLAGAPAC